MQCDVLCNCLFELEGARASKIVIVCLNDYNKSDVCCRDRIRSLCALTVVA